MTAGNESVVEMRGITKRFGEVVANDHIDFSLRRGDIHALLGENGAGKTTLMNILSGLYHPDRGEIFIQGRKAKLASPNDALALGVGMVYQHLTLVPTLSVLENILLGTNKKYYLMRKYAEQKLKEISRIYGLEVDLETKIWQLSAGEQERVEIIKLFYRGSDVLILDEPTSFLSPIEIKGFFKVLKNMVASGKSVVFITHKIEEALDISSRITVLSEGEKSGEIDLDGIDIKKEEKQLKNRIVNMMFKKAAFGEGKKKGPEKDSLDAVLTLEGVTATNDRGLETLKEVSFTVHRGEVFGIAGVDGYGQKELAEVIAGQRKVISGRITLNKEDITNMPVSLMNERGIYYITEDRITEGSVANFSLAENAIFRCYKKKPYVKSGIFLNNKAIRDNGNKLIRDYSIKAQDSNDLVKTLSGGNIQKLILARELSYNPSVLVANKPTHGLDVMTTRYIRDEIRARSRRGVSVLLISTDLDELKEVSDRIGVMYKGELIRVVPGKEATKEEIGRLMLGIMN
ncbi:MAG: ABC transporter ATP-binding protein [Spirochaetota bacterium]|nr:MAG: ABC transporter ATP-binding protein [Spirochaetota bacterium]